MKKVLRNFIAFTLIVSAISANAQPIRYLDNVFTNVTVTSDVQFAENISILPTVLSGGVNPPALTPIMCDIYEPTGDNLTDRPVVILLHTGSFLPQVINGQPTGDKLDSSIVQQCMRWARKGYVAVAMNNRLGWNPTSPNQDDRTSTLLQAAYRGIQDAKAMVRFLRKTEDIDGNPYGINPNQIALGGQGTGGYISLGYATLDTIGDNTPWQEIYLTKFFNLTTMQPYVYPPIFGNYDGTDSTFLPIIDSVSGQIVGYAPMNIPNWPSYSNDINMAFNIGGCLADSSWLEAGDVPMVSLHCTKDPYGPYANGDVIVPTTGNYVVEVQGSYIVQKHQAMYGNNAVFANAGFSDAFTNAANANNDGYEGLYPFLTPTPSSTPNAFGESYEEEGAPWDWWDNTWYDNMHQAIHSSPAGYGPANSILGNPNMSSTKGNAYLDTIQGYLNPRMFLALGLPTILSISASEVIDFATEIYPNPTTEKVNVVSYAAAINSIEIYNIHGQVVYSKEVNANAIKINTTTLSNGVYIMNIKSDKATITRKLIVE
ncbi:MAG TPA: T9SS type A sorting domain-containing protein [Flavobacteriales bacterium]|nr:T9SS type A sorting domain-containing protein [Flavobacteriales bacterium]